MSDKIGVAITTFNNLPYLRLCLRSLRGYSQSDTEILIHVDGSTDGTREWLEAEGLDYVWDEHQGCYHGFNEAISRASGTYIALFADDMYASPDWDKNLLKHAEKYRALAPRLVEPFPGSMPPIRDFGRTHDSFDEEGFLSYAKEISTDKLLKWGTVAANFFSRELFEECKGFDEAFHPYGFGDTDLMFRFKIKHPEMEFMCCQSSILYHFRAKSKEQFSAEQKKEINDRTSAYFHKKWGMTLQEMHRWLGV